MDEVEEFCKKTKKELEKELEEIKKLSRESYSKYSKKKIDLLHLRNPLKKKEKDLLKEN
jgi:hypothetical protein